VPLGGPGGCEWGRTSTCWLLVDAPHSRTGIRVVDLGPLSRGTCRAYGARVAVFFFF